MANKEHVEHHIVPASVFVKVFIILIVLTVITVLASRVDFGALNGLIAVTIATAKALLVAAFFMHLKYDELMNRLLFASGFFFLLLLYVFVVLDNYTRVIQNSTL